MLTLDSLLEKHAVLQSRIDEIEKNVNKLTVGHDTVLRHVDAVCRQAHKDLTEGEVGEAQDALFELLFWLETAT